MLEQSETSQKNKKNQRKTRKFKEKAKNQRDLDKRKSSLLVENYENLA